MGDGIVPIAEFERAFLIKLLTSAGVENPRDIVERFMAEREAYCRRLLAELSRADRRLIPVLADKLACSPNLLDKALSLWLMGRAYRDSIHKMLYV
ncbi:MAG: hypothetical protein DRK00_00765 [Thermoprotei archaeon]|nr:MAG: hypothetical protein DRK00_00765 [Thermoprotei archaeon]